MHYRNGRTAKQGDHVIHLNGRYSRIGYLVNLIPESETCNADLISGIWVGHNTVTVKECLHMDDAMERLMRE